MSREIGKTTKERERIKRKQNENKTARERLESKFHDAFDRYPYNSDELLKYRLYKDQKCKCAYSMEPIKLDKDIFFEPGYVEIDHILPYSRSFDNSYSNKVLVLQSENQMKRNRTPYEYFRDEKLNKWVDYECWVKENIENPKKRNKLLTKNYSEVEKTEWAPRTIVNTQYIARFFAQFIRSSLKFSDPKVKLPVVCMNGRITSMLRGLWGISKVREDDDLHHAKDAAVIATITPRMVKLITEYRKARESKRYQKNEVFVDTETGEIIDFKYSFPMPWKNFRLELIARLSDNPAAEIEALKNNDKLSAYTDKNDVKPVIVSRKPQRKVTGQMHKETIRSVREEEGAQISVIRKNISELKMADKDNLYAPDTNKKLYDAIFQRMKEYDGDAKKAFEQPFYKPTNTPGKQGPQVKTVKLKQTKPSGIKIRGGIVDNANMVRIDIFTKAGKYYIVPVYTSHVLCGELPNRAITRDKDEKDWQIIDAAFEFKFSLYPYDLIKFVTKKDTFFGYYRGCDRTNGAIKISLPNKNEDSIRKTGPREIIKYEIDVLGNYYEVKKEDRRGLEDFGNLKSGEDMD